MSENVMDPVLSPVYLLRSYAWALLKANDSVTWDESKYGGMVPMVPLAEEPELDAYSGPHIVYGYALDSSAPLPIRRNGSMTFVVYDDNFRRLTKTMTILATAFERLDESARDVNAYTSTIPAFVGLSFAHIGVGFAEGGTPEETEGDRQSAVLNIRFEYHVNYNVITNLV